MVARQRPQGYWKLQDNAASTTVVNSLSGGNNATNVVNTNAKTTAGPNSWLPAALSYNGSSDFTDCGTPSGLNNAIACSYSGWAYRASTGTSCGFGGVFGDSSSGGLGRFSCIWFTDGNIYFACGPLATYAYCPLSGTGWKFIAVSYQASGLTNSDRLKVWINGVAQSLTFVGTTPNSNIGTVSPFAVGKDSSNRFTGGANAGVSVFTRAVALGDFEEMRLGPEPLNTVAPTISGTATLTATTGTWDSQSNGTLSYSYQWTKDGVDISGATSSTYSTGSVVGVYRCRVRASNNGGFDSAQDTLSNSIHVSGASAAAAVPTVGETIF